jgi:hypothetical protein
VSRDTERQDFLSSCKYPFKDGRLHFSTANAAAAEREWDGSPSRTASWSRSRSSNPGACSSWRSSASATCSGLAAPRTCAAPTTGNASSRGGSFQCVQLFLSGFSRLREKFVPTGKVRA